ncbi:MAG TPA: hypothetical protein VHR66_10850 [Gemmataceae bacterium]|nr:hypothetical protein [Gemmataceae bacterium]
MTEKYRFEELDRETRDYLVLARSEEGKGAPGMFIGQTDYWPIVALILGFAIIILTVIFAFPPVDPPMKEAMIQTAGFLLGGWLVIAAIRVWAAGKSSNYAGNFIYADPENLYQASGSTIRITDLGELREAKAVQNFNEGKYQNTSITLKVGHDRPSIQVNDQDRARRLTVFLNAVAYMKDGGEDGKDDVLRKLSPEAMGSVAKHVAKTGEFPSHPERTEEGHSVRVPRPRKDGRASTGIFGMLAVIFAGVALFLGFLAMNYPVRDEVVFSRIKELPQKEQPFFLRQYLAEPNFKAHRDEVQQLLNKCYEDGVRTNVNGTDDEMKKGLGEVVLALKDKPQPVASLLTVEDEMQAGQGLDSSGREKTVQQKLADKWGATIGDELVVFATLEDPDKPGQSDKSIPAMIEVRWKFTAAGSVDYTLKFRKSPDEEPFSVTTGNQPSMGSPIATIEAMSDQIVSKTVGMTKLRPLPPPDDF